MLLANVVIFIYHSKLGGF